MSRGSTTILMLTYITLSGCGCPDDLVDGDWQVTSITQGGTTTEYPWTGTPGDGDYHYGELWLSLSGTDGTLVSYQEYIDYEGDSGCELGYDELDPHSVTVSTLSKDTDACSFTVELGIADLGLTLTCLGSPEDMRCSNTDDTYQMSLVSGSYSTSVDSMRGGSTCD